MGSRHSADGGDNVRSGGAVTMTDWNIALEIEETFFSNAQMVETAPEFPGQVSPLK